MTSEKLGRRGARSTFGLRSRLQADGDLLVALFVFLANTTVFLALFGPERQGYSDVVRGWEQLNGFFTFFVPSWGPENQIELRILMVLVTLAVVFILRAFKLIDRDTLFLYLALPLSAFLATRIRLEFLFFPLALISLKFSVRKEIAVIASLLGISIILGEQNGLVIVAFRVVLLFLRHWNVRWALLGAVLVAVVIVSEQFDALSSYFPAIASYSYTRDVANPEYSLTETVGVLLSSSVLSINPYIDFPIAIPIAVLVIAFAIGPRVMAPGYWAAIVQSPGFKALVVTVVTFTSITHAFQNARYYFFFVPLMASALGLGGIRRVMFLSVPAVIAMAIYYSQLSPESEMVLRQLVELWTPRLWN